MVYVEVLEVKRVMPVRPVERGVVDHTDDDSSRHLPRYDVFLDMVELSGRHGERLTRDSFDRVLRVSDFKRPCLRDEYGRTQHHLLHVQLAFVNLELDVDFKLRFVKHRDAFCLMSDDPVTGYKLKINKCKLYV